MVRVLFEDIAALKPAQPNGSIPPITIINSGSGYSGKPSVTVSNGNYGFSGAVTIATSQPSMKLDVKRSMILWMNEMNIYYQLHDDGFEFMNETDYIQFKLKWL